MTVRRKLMLALGAGAHTPPFAALAQAPTTPAGKIWRVGFFAANNRPTSIDTHQHGAFARGMRELGYVEGKNLQIEYRCAEARPELPAVLAAELVQMTVDAIVIDGSPPTLAAQKATATIPLVFVGPGDPVGIGLVKSLARPGGNTTGLSSNTAELGPKRLEVLLAMAAPVPPKVSHVAVLTNPRTPAHRISFARIRAAGETLGITVQQVEVSTPQDIDNAFLVIKRDKVGALMVSLDAFLQQQKDQIAQLALKHRLPCMAPDRMYVQAGCLMSYGGDLEGMFRYAATYVDKIFKGRKPEDLPVEQPTRIELVINGKTAKALGLAIPHSPLISADRLIE